jgi:RNA polymerase sigma-70 factor (ECF subfamily)
LTGAPTVCDGPDDKLAASATERLTSALAGGDASAVDAFYRRYFDWLYAQARRATQRDEAFCLDVVQDAVLRIIRTVRTVKCEKRFRAWLRLVVQTAAWDKLRSERRRQQHERAAVAARFGDAGDEQPCEDEQLAWLKDQIARLDPQIVRMVELRFGQRWTLARISGLLGLSIGTIDGRLRRALQEIRQRAIEEFEPDE